MDEVESFRAILGYRIVISILFGIHTRERKIGYFRNPKRKQITLRKGDHFILTADRRVTLQGCRRVFYCNCISVLPFITPNHTIKIGDTVILSVRTVVRQSIVCTIDVGGIIRPLDVVIMPISAHDSEISGEEIEDIDIALQYIAHSIVVKTPRNRKFFNSIDEFIREKINGSVHMITMCKTAELKNLQQEHFITNTYDGVIYKLHNRFCGFSEEDPIVPSKIELSLMQHLHECRKPFYLMAELSQDGQVDMPNVSKKFPDVLHYYTDGFLVPLSCEGETDYLYKFASRMVHIHPMERAVSIRRLLNNDLIDHTSSGRLVFFRNAALASFSMKARAIILRTKTGRLALEMAQFRPACQIFAINDNPHVAIKLVLNKAIKNIYGFSNLSWDRSNPKSWVTYQRKMYLRTVYVIMQKRLLLQSDRIILLAQSTPIINYMDQCMICTVADFLRSSESEFFCENHNGVKNIKILA